MHWESTKIPSLLRTFFILSIRSLVIRLLILLLILFSISSLICSLFSCLLNGLLEFWIRLDLLFDFFCYFRIRLPVLEASRFNDIEAFLELMILAAKALILLRLTLRGLAVRFLRFRI